MRLSGEGVTYMPNGQWPVWRREAYSRETAVRVRAGVASSEMLPVRALGFVVLLAGEERSMDGEGTRLESILEAIDTLSKARFVLGSSSEVGRRVHVPATGAC